MVLHEQVLSLQRRHLVVTHSDCARLSQVRRVARICLRVLAAQGCHGYLLLRIRVRLIERGVERFFSARQYVYLLFLQAIALDVEHALADVVEFEVCAAHWARVPLGRIRLILLLIMVAFEVVQVSCTCGREIYTVT